MTDDLPTAAVAIPTYNRERVLVDTVRQVLEQECRAREVLVIDQTTRHENATEDSLMRWQAEGRIRWIRQFPPNLPAARNRALLETSCEVIIFVDDDVILPSGFLGAHLKNYTDPHVIAVAGRTVSCFTPSNIENLVTPRRSSPLFDFKNFRLDGMKRVEGVGNLVGANHSVRRNFLLQIGGYDTNYIGSEFDDVDIAIRLWRAGGMVVYDPEAWLHHLMVTSGGLDVRSNRMRLWKRYFAVHYFYLRHIFPHACAWIDVPLSNFRRLVLCKQNIIRPWILPWAVGSYVYAFIRAAVTQPRLLTVARGKLDN